MHTIRLLCFVSIFWLVSTSASAQQAASPSASPTPSDSQAVTLLQQSLGVLAGVGTTTDVTMTGTVTATAGTSLQSGTITMAATAVGQSRVAFNFPSGGWVTTSDYTLNPRVSTTSSSAGTTSDSPQDLLGPHPAWFYPAFLISAALTTDYVPSNYSQPTHGGVQVQHVTVAPHSPMPLFRSTNAAWVPLTVPPPEPNIYFGQQDLYIAPSSLYPSALDFRVQGQTSQTSSGSNPPVYLPEEVRYMNYEIVQGRPVATHLQVYIGSVLFYDIQISSAVFNTGVVIAAN